MHKNHTQFRRVWSSQERQIALLGRPDMEQLYETADPKTKKKPSSMRNDTDRLVHTLREKAKVTWIGAINHFRLSKEKYRHDTLLQTFLDEAQTEIQQKTTAAVGMIRGLFQWTKRARFLTLQHQVALKKCEGALERISNRHREIEGLITMDNVANELENGTAPIPLESSDTQELKTALLSVRGELQEKVASHVEPTPQHFESALQTEPRLKETLAYFKIVPEDRLDWYIKRNEEGYKDLIHEIDKRKFLDDDGVDMPGAQKAARAMAEQLQYAKGYSAFKLARPDVNAMQPAPRLEALIKGDYHGRSLAFNLPSRPEFRVRITGKHADDKSALVGETPSRSNPKVMERVVMAMGEQGPSIMCMGKTKPEIFTLRDANFHLIP